MAEMPEQTPYQVLEIEDHASFEQIDAAYHQMTQMVSGDSLALYAMMGDDEAEQLRELVEEAYALLRDPDRRHAYDVAHHAEQREDRRREADPVARMAALARLDETEHDEEAPHLRESAHHTPAYPQPTVAPAPKRQARARAPLFTPRSPVPLTEQTAFTGELLQQLRESAGASLDDLGDITKVGRRYLVAIESDNYAALPAAVYVRGFLTQYARALGLEPGLIVKSYMDHYQTYLSQLKA